MIASEYLVRFGRLGDFGRFRAEPALHCERGQFVVVRTYRGLEIGEVLRETAEHHLPFLPNTTVGALLRHVGERDRTQERELLHLGQQILDRASTLAEVLDLPLTFLDAEVLLDGQRVILHHLSGGACDPRELVSTLARESDRVIELTNLSPEPAEPEEAGCGSCGSDGGCGDCGSESGGCGSCASKLTREHFASLRTEMERQRMPLI